MGGNWINKSNGKTPPQSPGEPLYWTPGESLCRSGGTQRRSPRGPGETGGLLGPGQGDHIAHRGFMDEPVVTLYTITSSSFGKYWITETIIKGTLHQTNFTIQ